MRDSLNLISWFFKILGFPSLGKSPNFEVSEGTKKHPPFKAQAVKKTLTEHSSLKETHKFAP